MRDGREEGTGIPQWVPLLVGLAIAGASVALWQVLRVEERAQVDRIVRSETNRVKGEIDARMETRIIALERMAMEWETRGGLREEVWESYVKQFFRQYPSTIAISWVDPSFRPRDVLPRHMEKSVRSIPLRERMRIGSAPDPAREKIGPKISSRLNLGGNGKAILASVPVLRDGRIEGYLLAVLRIDVLLGKILENVALDYAIAIDDGSGVIYTRDRPAGEGEDPPGWGATLERHEMNWRIRVSPTDKLKKEMGSSIDEITLAGGIAIAALLTLASGLARKAGRRAREAEAANRELEVVIAQRLRVEEELRKSGAYSRSLLEVALDPLVTIGPDGKITDVNHATESVTGFPREALVGADFTEYFTEPEKAREGYKQVFAEGFVTDYPLTIRHREGRLVDVLYNASVYRDMQGNVLGVFAAARDITERKRANEDLRKAVAYNRSLIESSLDPLVTISSDGAITDVNVATEKVTGLPRETLVGTDFSDYFTDPEKAREGYRKVFREGSVQDYALEIQNRNGKVTPVLYNASVYRDVQGNALGVFAAARDVTERMKAEQALSVMIEQLARSNEELEKFAYVASHDLQEPLRIISSFTQLLSRRYRGNLDSEADEFIGYVVDGTTRMQRLINDLLAYSRVGTRGGKFEPTDSSAALGRALENLGAAIEESGAVILHGPLPTLVADGTQLTQLFQNLVGNAIKFRTNRLPEVRISARETPGEWIFSVEDNGIGIDPKYFDRIFEIFQRLHGKTEYPGSGIGLAICRRIVERHGGRLWVESEPGEGTTFFFSIPANGGTAA